MARMSLAFMQGTSASWAEKTGRSASSVQPPDLTALRRTNPTRRPDRTLPAPFPASGAGGGGVLKTRQQRHFRHAAGYCPEGCRLPSCGIQQTPRRQSHVVRQRTESPAQKATLSKYGSRSSGVGTSIDAGPSTVFPSSPRHRPGGMTTRRDVAPFSMTGATNRSSPIRN